MSDSKLLVIVSLAASLLMLGVGMIVALLPQRVLDLSGSLQQVGYLAAAFALPYLMVQLPIGRLADRLGAKPFLILGYALCCLSGVVLFYAGSPEAIFVGRFIQGAGEAPVWALGPALLVLAYPHAKGRAIGIYNASIHLGLTIGPLLGILLVPVGGAGSPYLLFAALCLAGGISLLLWLPRVPSSSRRAPGPAPTLRDLCRLLGTREPMMTLVGVTLFGAGYGSFVSVLPASLALAKGFGAPATGVFFAVFYAAISLAQLTVGPLSDRHGRQGYMVAGLVMAALGFASWVAIPFPWTYAPLALASLGLGVFCVSSLAHLNECVPESLKATISGGYYVAWGLGYFLGPLLVARIGEVSPLGGYPLLALLLALQAGMLWRRP